MSLRTLSRNEVANHNTPEDCWCIIDHCAYDLTGFLDAHPGGCVVLAQSAGKDVTVDFFNLHRAEVLNKYRPQLIVGVLQGEKEEIIPTNLQDLSSVPYAEPLWLRARFCSPYYTQGHRKFQKAVRRFFAENVNPEAREKELDGTYISQKLLNKLAETNILAMRLGPGEHLYSRRLLGGVINGREFDYFHDLILTQEFSRSHTRGKFYFLYGFQDGLMGGVCISLTAVKQWLRDDDLRERVMEEVLSGRKKMCLAISEAFAGSDVNGLRTIAQKTPDGQCYIVTGTKKWITNGMFSDYFVTACRTDKGISVLLIPRGHGVETKTIRTAYSTSAGTAYVEFSNVRVPMSHLLGEEDQGAKVIMSNFNHERFVMVCSTARWCIAVVEECLKWCNQRISFKKKLIEQPVLRQKLARMISLAESIQAWLESITLQMCKMDYEEQGKYLSGPIALLKAYSTTSATEVSSIATNIFGGRGLTETGMGRVIEMFNRTNKFDAILGGTEEILADLGVRQVMKVFPKSVL